MKNCTTCIHYRWQLEGLPEDWCKIDGASNGKGFTYPPEHEICANYFAKVELKPSTCNICGGLVNYISNDRIYGKKYGSGFCYYCEECRAYVGTHEPRPKEALGLLANAEMRKAKIKCHEVFDIRWKGKPKAHKKRNSLYAWLAKELNIPTEQCHFGYFDLETLQRAYAILTKP